MLPLLRQKKDIVVIKAKGAERCKKYDVVLFRRGPKYVLHRVLKVRTRDYIIVGDNQYRREFGVKEEQILGIMTRCIRNGKDISSDDWKYRLYVHLWCDFYHIRALILYCKYMVGRVKRKIKRLLNKRLARNKGEGS